MSIIEPNLPYSPDPDAKPTAVEASGSEVVQPVRARRRPRRKLARREAAAAAAAFSAAGDEGELQLGRVIRQAVRGKIPWIVALGLLTGALAAGVAWKMVKPDYHSAGLVRIAYTLPAVLQQTDQNEPLQMFDTFMQSQRLLITSRRVLDAALQDPIWRATGRQVPADPDAWFAEHLKVDIKPRSEFIEVSVSDKDPATAAAAVTSIINGYAELYNSEDRQLERQRIGVLEDRQKEIEGEIDQLSAQVKAGSQEFGSANLGMFYEAAVIRVSKLQSALEDIRTAMATAPSRPDGAATPAATTAAELSDAQIAACDATMHGYVDEVERLQTELKRLKAMGYDEAHASVTLAKFNLEQGKERASRYADEFRAFHTATAQNLNDPRSSPVQTAGKSLEQLRASESMLAQHYENEKKEMVRLGNKQTDLRQLNEKLAARHEELDALKRRIETLRAEGSLGGRLSINSTGEIPLSPDRDPRMKLAAAAGVAGMGLPVAVVLGWSLLSRRRFQYGDDTELHVASRVPMLGILPVLTGDQPEPEQVMGAAHSVHQIRVTLRSKAAEGSSSIYMITSAAAGEGKTSLTMSLALSYAASRLRTLVVDCDLVGRQLTNTLGGKDSSGVTEALAAGSMKGLLRKTDAGIYVLTAGRTGSSSACEFAPERIRPLLAEFRRYFDVILLDTGPILGSVEAAVLAQEVDGVVFTISRGQQHDVVEKAVRRLESLKAKMEGVVFNKAKPNDFDNFSYFSSSHRSKAAGAEASVAIAALPDRSRLLGFGPLVRAVAADVAVN